MVLVTKRDVVDPAWRVTSSSAYENH